jgi:hypothetical protein
MESVDDYIDRNGANIEGLFSDLLNDAIDARVEGTMDDFALMSLARKCAQIEPKEVVVSDAEGAWRAAGWLSSSDVATCVAEALLQDAEGASELEALRRLADATCGELIQRLGSGAVLLRLARLLKAKLVALPKHDSMAASAQQLHNKFVQGGGETLQYGDLATFFGGLEAKIGTPEPKIWDAMEREHTAKKDSDDPFTTVHYGMTTTPRQEWWFVAEPERQTRWPVEQRIGGGGAKPRARLALEDDDPKSDTLQGRLEATNAKLQRQGETAVLVEEAVGESSTP